MDKSIDLADILAKHKAWLAKAEGGQRANLTDANLHRANLTDANLRYANLCYANLRYANLCYADLSGAYLSGANLTDADLRGANLCYANLRYANLCYADLSGADLTGAYLHRANLTGAYLRYANLCYADLSGANLTGAIGIRWGQIGPVGQGRRLLTAWAHDSLPEPVIAGGCFRGTFDAFREAIAGCPWDWAQGTDEDRDRWRAECSEAADWLESKVA